MSRLPDQGPGPGGPNTAGSRQGWALLALVLVLVAVVAIADRAGARALIALPPVLLAIWAIVDSFRP